MEAEKPRKTNGKDDGTLKRRLEESDNEEADDGKRSRNDSPGDGDKESGHTESDDGILKRRLEDSDNEEAAGGKRSRNNSPGVGGKEPGHAESDDGILKRRLEESNNEEADGSKGSRNDSPEDGDKKSVSTVRDDLKSVSEQLSKDDPACSNGETKRWESESSVAANASELGRDERKTINVDVMQAESELRETLDLMVVNDLYEDEWNSDWDTLDSSDYDEYTLGSDGDDFLESSDEDDEFKMGQDCE